MDKQAIRDEKKHEELFIFKMKNDVKERINSRRQFANLSNQYSKYIIFKLNGNCTLRTYR